MKFLLRDGAFATAVVILCYLPLRYRPEYIPVTK